MMDNGDDYDDDDYDNNNMTQYEVHKKRKGGRINIIVVISAQRFSSLHRFLNDTRVKAMFCNLVYVYCEINSFIKNIKFKTCLEHCFTLFVTGVS